jgi:hypothetical protein
MYVEQNLFSHVSDTPIFKLGTDRSKGRLEAMKTKDKDGKEAVSPVQVGFEKRSDLFLQHIAIPATLAPVPSLHMQRTNSFTDVERPMLATGE